MNILIRYLRQGAEGILEYQDSESVADVVKIGSAADRSIQLIGRTVGAKHAVVTRSGSPFSLNCARGLRARVNAEQVEAARIAVGDKIEIGGHQLRLLTPPAGFDLAIEVQLNSGADASEFEAAFRTDLGQTWLSKRKAAWMLALLTLCGALLIPLGAVYVHRLGIASPRFLPDDTIWTAGPLSAAHEHAVGRKCNACHQQLFVHVQDSACRKCHQPIMDHVARQDLLLTDLGPPQRCAQCHREHDGGASQIAVKDDQLCIACHADSAARFGKLKVEPVSGFSKSNHPAFFVTLQKPSDFGWVTQREPLASAHEQSNLKYSHAQHLDGSRVTNARGGGALGCVDCHTPALDGEHFVPVTMAKNCASCHELTFDRNAPARQLPHGRPLDAMLVIEDYFARKFSDPTIKVERTAPARRLPDRDSGEIALETDTCSGPTYLCANRRASAEIENQFARRGCVSCHVVVDNHAKEVHDRFQVTPVRLTYDYFSKVHFSHKAHAIQKDRSGDDACLSCHKARVSKQSTDVMIPNIGNCLECHGDRRAQDKVTVQCVSCHAYHPVSIMTANRQER